MSDTAMALMDAALSLMMLTILIGVAGGAAVIWKAAPTEFPGWRSYMIRVACVVFTASAGLLFLGITWSAAP